jgi:hypothetical protein
LREAETTQSAQWLRCLDDWRIALRIPRETNGFSLFSTASRPDLGLTQPVPNGYRRAFQVINGPTRENDHSPPSTFEVTNELSYTSIPPCAVL